MGGHDYNGQALKEDFSNYKDWSLEVRSYLMAKGLWSVIVDKASASAKDNEKVLGIIGLSLCAALRATYCDSEEYEDDKSEEIFASELWAALKQRFTGSIAARRSDLRRDYNGLSQERSESIAVYLNRARTMRLELLGVLDKEEKVVYTEQHMVEIVIAGLAPAFKSAQAQLRLDRAKVKAVALTMAELETFLLQAEADMLKADEVQPAALLVRTGRGRNGGQQGRGGKGPRCFECDEYGHFARQCPNRKGRGQKGEDRDEDYKVMVVH